jgi:putative membrane protein
MQILRNALWLLIAMLGTAFVAINWHKAPLNLWPLELGYLHVDWPVGMVALVFFLLGVVPTALVNKARRWRLKRRIAMLENNIMALTPTPPLATSTQFEAAQTSAAETVHS